MIHTFIHLAPISFLNFRFKAPTISKLDIATCMCNRHFSFNMCDSLSLLLQPGNGISFLLMPQLKIIFLLDDIAGLGTNIFDFDFHNFIESYQFSQVHLPIYSYVSMSKVLACFQTIYLFCPCLYCSLNGTSDARRILSGVSWFM